MTGSWTEKLDSTRAGNWLYCINSNLVRVNLEICGISEKCVATAKPNQKRHH